MDLLEESTKNEELEKFKILKTESPLRNSWDPKEAGKNQDENFENKCEDNCKPRDTSIVATKVTKKRARKLHDSADKEERNEDEKMEDERNEDEKIEGKRNEDEKIEDERNEDEKMVNTTVAPASSLWLEEIHRDIGSLEDSFVEIRRDAENLENSLWLEEIRKDVENLEDEESEEDEGDEATVITFRNIKRNKKTHKSGYEGHGRKKCLKNKYEVNEDDYYD